MREQAVDEVLQLKLYETVTSRASAGKVKKGGNRPVIVLATCVLSSSFIYASRVRRHAAATERGASIPSLVSPVPFVSPSLPVST